MYHMHITIKKNKYNFQLPNQVQDKINKNIDTNIIDEIVNKNVSNWSIGLRETQNNIDINIYKNEFIITIPVTEQNVKEK